VWLLSPSGIQTAMTFKYSLTVRSQLGKSSDCGRALERVAFYPGVTSAQILSESADSITIGYNGTQRSNGSRDLDDELRAEGLVGDGAFWEEAPVPLDGVKNHPEAFRRLTPVPDNKPLPFIRRQ
jgi:hypothetical protein